ncbi:MAG: alpha/beta hydrolase [Rhodospirillaceae bacterium]|nr:alpha/beta hydrolase [Rhodospirillaceae bacterium]|tara:strand:+ start:26725 stop:27597 length:873 start_codon:yes stop_codon:yes gene_type:complete
MFDGFTNLCIKANGININVMKGGRGPAILMLHGYPQTHFMWHKVAPILAQHFTVILTDLRGYGDSDKPISDPNHQTYSKRTSGKDQFEVMQELGYESFAIVGHDRGGRVGHRMAIDYSKYITRLAVLDIVPTLFAFEQTDMEKAMGYFHWFFLAQKSDMPEHLIGFDPKYFLQWCLKSWGGSLNYFSSEALAEYERCFSNPDMIKASCEDYRAASSIDLEDDKLDSHNKINCPVLALWGRNSAINKWYDVLEVWRDRAIDVTGGSIDSRHFLAEEKPEEVARALFFFLRV